MISLFLETIGVLGIVTSVVGSLLAVLPGYAKRLGLDELVTGEAWVCD